MQRLSRDGNGDPGHRGAAAGPAFVESEVGLRGAGYYGYSGGCATDEGYGRHGSCDTY